MIPKGVYPIVACALLAGWLMPSRETVGNAVSEASHSESTILIARPPEAEMAGEEDIMSGGEVTLDRAQDGHFYAQAEIDGEQVKFLVDTGASVVALTAADAELLGFDWNDSELRKVGRGASGDVIGVPVTIPQLTVGSRAARDVPAVIIPEGLDVSLLGQSFLSKVGSVNISGNRMTLK